jgi:CHAT domain-containing protein
VNPNQSVLYLEHHETLTLEDLSGVVSNLGSSRPLIFFNACQLGRNAVSLTDKGGWVSQLLRMGAGAFIGAYWSIYDSPASAFAQAFYRLLLSGIPIGKAARQARIEIKSAGTVFANPLAIVQHS